MYETSVGHNTALIIDFAPKPDGSLPPEQVSVAAALGSYVSTCYGAPIVAGSGNESIITLMPSGPVSIDRVLVSEDQHFGQLVRAFTVTATLADGTTATLATGTSVGNKFIAVLPKAETITSVTLNVTAIAERAATAVPAIKAFAVFACDALAEAQRADLDARGFAQPPPSTAAERRRTRGAGEGW
jgi:hypothetical protein